MRSRNIVFNKIRNADYVNENYEVATYAGVGRKTLFYLLMVLLGAVGGISIGLINQSLYLSILVVSSLTTFIFALVGIMSPRASKIAGTLYCIAEGTLVGCLSMIYGAIAEGAVVTALLSTLAVFMIIATLFATNAVKTGSRFRRFLITFSISFIVAQLILYLIMSFSGQQYNILLCLGVSAITVFLASLYLLMDLDTVRLVVEGRYPKEYEWYFGFSLMVTIVWLYVEILRLLAKLQSRD